MLTLVYQPLIRVMLLILVLSLNPVDSPQQYAEVHVEPDLPVQRCLTSIVTNQGYNCLQVPATPIPGCRWKMLLLTIRGWLVTHVRLDTSRWGLPVYVAFDQANQWQQVSVFCVHLTRSGS